MTSLQAKSLRKSLASKDRATRLADREKLLADRQANKPEKAPKGLVDNLELRRANDLIAISHSDRA